MFKSPLREHIRRFLGDRAGNFAMLTGLTLIPIALVVGLGVDYSRSYSSKTHLQELADSAVLAVARSSATTEADMRVQAVNFIDGNFDARSSMSNVEIEKLTLNNGQIDLVLGSKVPTYFMGLINVKYVDIDSAASAVRGGNGQIELAMVLDNTFSMSDQDATGAVKLDALKIAAKKLTGQIMSAGGDAKMALVPYADLVNVSPEPRSSSWLNVEPDRHVDAACVTKPSAICVRPEPGPCTGMVDGIEQPRTCGCLEWQSDGGTYQSCTPEADYTWYGCVGMRAEPDRLTDANPSSRYPGFADTGLRCPSPILPLGATRASLETSIDNMKYQWPGYQPNTYIPIGLMWGLNVLSPGAPFPQAKAYDADNRRPRKVIVLMTDGENTMAAAPDGRPRGFGWFTSDPAEQADLKALTDGETATLCEYIKNDKKIEIYSIAFMVDDPVARKLLENCSTDKTTHYFDAVDANQLLAAFDKIGETLTAIRLVQ